jgi:hypothetical protein
LRTNFSGGQLFLAAFQRGFFHCSIAFGADDDDNQPGLSPFNARRNSAMRFTLLAIVSLLLVATGSETAEARNRRKQTISRTIAQRIQADASAQARYQLQQGTMAAYWRMQQIYAQQQAMLQRQQAILASQQRGAIQPAIVGTPSGSEPARN